MRYYLSDDQFHKLWKDVAGEYYKELPIITRHCIQINKTTPHRNSRQDIWNNHLKDRFQLIYSEIMINGQFSCCVIGPEDKINWFLMYL